jgi:hypothetical protein
LFMVEQSPLLFLMNWFHVHLFYIFIIALIGKVKKAVSYFSITLVLCHF